MTIKILHYLRNLDLGGTAKTCQLFFEHATKEDFEVCLVYEKTGDQIRLEEFVKGSSVCRGNLYEINSYTQSRFDARPLQTIIDEHQIDILHVYRSGYSEPPDPGIDVNVSHFIETNVFGFIDLNDKIDRTLFMSKWLMNHAVRNLNHPRFDFVNNPVEMPSSSQTLLIREQWGKNVIVLGRVGRPDNGIYNAVHVEAARLLRMQGYDVRFLVVAPPSNMIHDLAKYDIPFHMIEPTTNPLLLSMAYNSMDIYAHARADGETFGVNIAEAMIHGLPVVTHIATPSFYGMGVFQSQTELVDNGKNGFVVQNDPASYAHALQVIIDNPELRDKFKDHSFKKATDQYHVIPCMKKLENIYRGVVNESH